MSNNSAQSVAEFQHKCSSKGFKHVQPENIVNTSKVAADYLARHDKYKKLPVYLIGNPVIEKALNERGIQTIGMGPDPPENHNPLHGVS